jgi:hypothetical protein
MYTSERGNMTFCMLINIQIMNNFNKNTSVKNTNVEDG